MDNGIETPNAFIGRTGAPSDADLAQALGAAKPLWDALIADLAAEGGVAVRKWKCYSPKAGWALRLKRGSRTIVWLAPCAGCFRVAFILGNKALEAARQLRLSTRAAEALERAQKYPEGTGVRLLVQRSSDIPAVKKLAGVKLRN